MARGPAPHAGPCKECGRERFCRITKQDVPFRGRVCRRCYNELRRHRYKYDPDYRQRRQEQANSGYDRHKHRAYMQQWRASKRQDPDSPEGVDRGATLESVPPKESE